jgi:Zn-dependent protease with chaperone function
VQQEQFAQSQSQQEAAAMRAEEARLRSLMVQGYDSNTSVKLAGALNGVATFIIVAFIFVGVSNGLMLGVLSVKQFSLGILLFPVLFGLFGWFLGWLSVLLLRVIAQGLLTVTQIEANTRRN